MSNILKKNKATVIFVAINVIIYFITYLYIFGKPGLSTMSGQNLVKLGGLSVSRIMNGEWYRFITSIFIHNSYDHLFNNMVCLFAIGFFLERMIGSKNCILVYLGGALFGNIIVFARYYYLYKTVGTSYVMAGSSGCIFAALGAMLMLAIMKGKQMGGLSTRGILAGALMILIPGYFVTEISFTSHMAGMIGGIIIGFFIALTIKEENNDEIKEIEEIKEEGNSDDC